MIIRPKGSPFDNDFSIPFMEEIYAILDEAKLEEVGMEVAWVGGAYRHTVEDVEVVIYDVSRTAGLSLLLVLFFITIIYQKREPLSLFLFPSWLEIYGRGALLIGSSESSIPLPFFFCDFVGTGGGFCHSSLLEIPRGKEKI